jgi:DNA-binding response OmpR family regulator
LTGHSDPENRLRAIEAGFDAYFCKPVNFTALRDRLVETRASH